LKLGEGGGRYRLLLGEGGVNMPKAPIYFFFLKTLKKTLSWGGGIASQIGGLPPSPVERRQ